MQDSIVSEPSPDSPEIRAAVSHLSKAVQRALLRIEQHRQALKLPSGPSGPTGAAAQCLWQPERLTAAETLEAQHRYLQGLRYRGAMPRDTGHADGLIEALNYED